MNTRNYPDGQEKVDVVVLGEGILPALDGTPDPVLRALEEVGQEHLQARAAWEQEREAMRQALAEYRQAMETNRRLQEEQKQYQARLAAERRRAERYKLRGDQLSQELRNLHKALYDGNVFSLILKSILTITGATRGLYITMRDGRLPVVRAAVDVDGYPKAPPSPFLIDLCQKVLSDQESFVCNGDDCAASFAQEPGPGERFQNILAAPVVLLKNLNGIVIVGDKLNGDFDQDDVETVISVGDQAGVVLENHQLQRDLQGAYLSIVSVLADAVEAKDPYTSGHCELVARLSRRTARRLGLDSIERGIVSYGGLLHDVGKIGVSDGILNKPGKLLPEEWDLMRSHVRVGRDLLKRVPLLERVADVVLHHHENFDGTGYPDGLAGETISLPARIVKVVDAYCAMISRRSYKESMSEEEARNELLRCRGTQFDPAVVDAFLSVLDKPRLDEEEDLFPGEPHLAFSEDFKYVVAGHEDGK